GRLDACPAGPGTAGLVGAAPEALYTEAKVKPAVNPPLANEAPTLASVSSRAARAYRSRSRRRVRVDERRRTKDERWWPLRPVSFVRCPVSFVRRWQDLPWALGQPA